MAVVDPVFLPLTEEGVKFRVWRVQKLQLVPVGETDWGKFYSGDCYLVFDGRHGGDHIYYWIGRHSSQDEQTVAAIKAVELDNLFSGQPVQHREVMGYESQNFRKLFQGGVICLVGGVESGLKQVTDQEHVARLFQVGGGKVPILREVELDWANINHGERRGLVTPADTDRRISTIVKEEICLYRCSDITGSLTINLLQSGNLQKEQLDSDDAFIIDAANLGIWIWLGR